MTERKGLSQILYLIIAASVLMMVALSLIFMFNDSVGGGTGDASACRTAISTQCSATGASTVAIPPNCLTQAQDGSQQFIQGAGDWFTASTYESGEDIYASCESFTGAEAAGDGGG